MDGATGRAAAAAIGRALADPAVRVVLLSGEGRSFMAGGDIASFRAAASPQERAALLAGVIEPFHGALLRLTDSGRITLAAAQGPVAGGGVSVFLMADLGSRAADATLTMAYSGTGAVPVCGSLHPLERRVR